MGGKRWQHVEVDQLEALIEELQPRDGERGDWDALAARLTPVEATKFEVRTGKSAQCKAVDLGLREKLQRAHGHGWEASSKSRQKPKVSTASSIDTMI